MLSALRSPLAVKVISTGCSLFLGAIFLGFAISKASAPTVTLSAIAKILPVDAARVALLALVCAEIVIGSFLLTGWRVRVFLFAATLLTMVFFVWTLWLSIYNPAAACGCGQSKFLTFGVSGARGSLLRATILLGFAVLGLVATMASRRTDETRVVRSIP